MFKEKRKMSKEQTVVQECFSQIGERFDGITRSLKRNGMPYDAECEYVTIPVESYVDTGISPEDKGFGMRWELPDVSNMDDLSFKFGCGGNPSILSNPYYFIYWASGHPKIYSIYAPATRIDKSVSNISGIHTASFMRGTNANTSPSFIDESSFTFSGTFYTNSNMPSFCLGAAKYDPDTIVICNKPVRIYSFYFNKFGEPINYYIPVRKGSEGFLYDLFTKQMLGSATDTPLIPGPDKAS